MKQASACRRGLFRWRERGPARLMRGRTVIAIAHRLSTLRSFDRIVVLKAGRVLQDGAPDVLMRRDGHYRELIRREVTHLGRHAA